MHTVPAFLLALGILAPSTVRALEREELEGVLARAIIDPAVPDREVRAFAAARIAKMPAIHSPGDWEREARRLRREVLERVVFRGPAAAWRDARCGVVWLDTIPGGPGYSIRKLRYEALPGLWIPALLYEPEAASGKIPVALTVNGHDPKGKSSPSKQELCINLVKRGMLTLNVEWLGMGQLRSEGFRHDRMNQLDLCGASGLAVFYLAMQRGLDVLLAQPRADASRVAMAGLSGGGWQTILLAALDERVTVANPVAGYSSFVTRVEFPSDLGDSEQTPVDLAAIADYAHLTALRAPRPTLVTYNAKDDCCFAAAHALPPLLDAARPVFELYAAGGRLRSHVNYDPGDHNFDRDNREAYYRILGDEFFAEAGSKYVASELPAEGEIKTAEELAIGLPPDNADFNTLALALSRDLPRDAALPDPEAAAAWRTRRRGELREILRADDARATGEAVGRDAKGGIQVTYWKLRVGDSWTVPAVELAPPAARGTALVVTDAGRAKGVATVERLLAAGQRVLAVDPFYLGESKIQSRDYLLALLIASAGRPALGVQAGQLAAIARFAAEKDGQPVVLVADGPRTSLMALSAAGLEETAIAGVECGQAWGSLKDVIGGNLSVQQAPEAFCFGLLARFDMPQLAALVAPRAVTMRRGEGAP